MTKVTGYLLTGDTGGAGPTVGDTFAPDSSLTFEANDHPILYSGTITYASVGDVHGMFFDVGGSWYFVPMTYFGGQPGDTGTVTEVHDPVQGTTGDEALTAPDGDGYVIYSGAGSSGIGSGSDTLTGGSGTDVLIFGDGDDTVYGGDGLDWIDDDGGLQLVGDNYLDGGGGMDFIYAGYGDDTILGGTGSDNIYAEADSDTIVFADGFGNDYVWGGETVGAGVDWDVLDFSAVTTDLTVALDGIGYGMVTDGASTVRFYEIEEIVTGSGDDFITAGADTLGLSFSSGAGNDTIWGGLGHDTAYGGDGADEIYLDDGNDLVYGEAGDDDLGGDAGDDTIYGGDGDDWIQGNEGADLLDGGAGNDTFFFAPGDGADTIADFNSGNTGSLADGKSANNDFIDLSAFYDDIWELHADYADDGALNQSNDGVDGVDYADNSRFKTGDSLTFTGATADGASFTVENTGVACFARGTAILTPAGEKPVERLRAGDQVVTADHGVQTIRWIGSRRVARSPALRPIRIAAGALGAGLPRRRLFVSPQHRLLVRSPVAERMTGARDVLVAAKELVRMRGIRPDHRPGHVRYFHILCDRHEIVFANGAPTETLWPGPMARRALGPETWAELVAIFPDIETRLARRRPVRTILEGPRRATLLRRHRRNRVPLFEPAAPAGPVRRLPSHSAAP